MQPTITQSGALFLAHHKDKLTPSEKLQILGRRIQKGTMKQVRRPVVRGRTAVRYSYRDDGR